MILSTGSQSLAAEKEGNSSEIAANEIEAITGTDDINTNIYSNKENIAIADGMEAVVEIPREAEDAISIDDGEVNQVNMYLPEQVEDEKGKITENGTIVYQNEEECVTVGVQPLQEVHDEVSFEGVRTTITINDKSAAKEYEFKYDLEEGCKLVTARDYLGEEYDTGEVYIVDTNNKIMSIIDPAWAKDANGNDIETYYKVKGNVLIQVVNFDENTAFPVVADPTVWQVCTCAGAIVWVVGTTIFSAAKVLKLKKAIKAAGGVKRAATAIITIIKQNRGRGAKWWKLINWEEYGAGIAAFGADLMGISDIRSSCTF